MKHTDFYGQYQSLHQIELIELFTAVAAHGGVYEFDEAQEAPIVAGYGEHSENIEDFRISRVDNNLKAIYGRPVNNGGDEERLEVAVGHVGYITDYIPPTEYIDNVSFDAITIDTIYKAYELR
jgi:hypothetical protein